MQRNILNWKNISLSLCAALTWASSSKITQSFNSDPTTQSFPKYTKTFIWGNGNYQAKPDTFIQFKNFEPKLIETFLGENKVNMKRIFFGEFHEAGIDTENKAYVWTKHVQPSSKEKEINDNERKNVKILDDSQSVIQIAFTKGFVWSLRKDGTVHQWPIQVIFDEEGDEVKEAKIGEQARHVTNLKDIKQIATGVDHFVALTNRGEVLTMGDDTFGIFYLNFTSFFIFVLNLNILF